MRPAKPIPNYIGGSGFNDGVKFAQDLSFMTEEDWAQRKIRLQEQAQEELRDAINRVQVRERISARVAGA